MAETPFQVTGVASGIGWDEIITKTLEMARKPAKVWQGKIDTLDYKKSLYSELASEFRKLQNTLLQLNIESTYKAKTAEFIVRPKAGGATNAADIAKATVNANAEIASWDIEVNKLATAQRYVSVRQNSTSTALGITGTFRIHVDTQVASITVEAKDTLADINSKIQQATDQKGQPLMATAKIFDNRLVIESALTGLDKTGALEGVNLTMSNKIQTAEYNHPTLANTKVKDYVTYVPRDLNNLTYPYPPQLLSVSSDGRNYVENIDYTYNPSNGAIRWETFDSFGNEFANHPADGDTIEVKTVLSTKFTVDSTTPLEDELQPPPSGVGFNPSTNFSITDDKGKTYKGTYVVGATAVSSTDDFVITDDVSGNYKILWGNGTVPPTGTGGSGKHPAVGDEYYVFIKPSADDYEYARNKVYLEEDGAASNANAALVQLGFMIEDAGSPGNYIFDTDPLTTLITTAQDAEVVINGVPVTVPDNEISKDSDSGELIPNVKLELLGVGHVVMNITQDASGAIEAMEKFVEAYNNVMTLINDRLSEKYNKNTIDTEDDYLQSLMADSENSKTVFGVLYGDQLLWNIKNQLRTMITNPVSTLSNALRSRKVQHPDAAINMEGAFYINSGGNVSRIDVAPTDTLEDIQRKLKFNTGINGTVVNSGGVTSVQSLKASMGLDVTISNGQLVIKKPSSTKTTETYNDTLTRSTAKIAYLYYVPDSSPPINGQLTISSGGTTYTENEDYKLNSFEDDNGVMVSQIEWLDGGKSPAVGTTYNVKYVFDPSAVTFTPVPSYAWGNVSSGAVYDIDFLDMHYDSAKIQLSSYGLTTESLDYGKSGLLEFDPNAFFQGIIDDSQQMSNVMVSFMKGLDSYVDNLASSSQVVVGGTTITKGRISAAMNNIDTEMESLQDQIDRLEMQLAQRQETLYKQYTNMELAIQKLNAQMSSVSQYLNMNANSN
ncbi:MAG: flagellar filament capping protein FliD [Synergistaceae bacterium]|jgi:flagellar hook-associated protein 2|nr:flagellar filament capping protein FliD [Synergistaceae bacterium]